MGRAACLLLRRFLQLAGGTLGLHLGGLWQARVAGARDGPVRACILVFYYGGPSHLDTFDPKPHAPAEVRGEFRTIPTSVPGLRVCEHLPRLARLMHKVALVRSVHHSARLHDSASIHALTGRPLDGPDRELFAPQAQTFPSFGSAVAYFRRGGGEEVPFASLPFTFRNVHDVPCQGAGFLGAAFDPVRVEVDAEARDYRADTLTPAAGLSEERLRKRRGLLAALSDGRTPAPLPGLYDRAFRLLD